MDKVKKFFPFSVKGTDVKSLVISIIIYIVIGFVGGLIAVVVFAAVIISIIHKTNKNLAAEYALKGKK